MQAGACAQNAQSARAGRRRCRARRRRDARLASHPHDHPCKRQTGNSRPPGPAERGWTPPVSPEQVAGARQEHVSRDTGNKTPSRFCAPQAPLHASNRVSHLYQRLLLVAKGWPSCSNAEVGLLWVWVEAGGLCDLRGPFLFRGRGFLSGVVYAAPSPSGKNKRSG